MFIVIPSLDIPKSSLLGLKTAKDKDRKLSNVEGKIGKLLVCPGLR